jgi:hypothetical protein
MTYKWNLTDFQNNANEYAKVICNEFFKTKENINGDEIMSITEVKQLNLFIVKELYDSWHDENQKLKSPYFDYAKPEVKKALDEFMNILSRNISINKVNFQALLEKATKNTAELYLEPKNYFVEEMRNLPDFKLDESWLKKNGKFFKDYNWVLRELLNRLNGLDFAFANEAIDWVNDIFVTNEIENHDKELLDISKLVGTVKAEIIKSEVTGTSFFDTINVPEENKKALIAKKELINEEKIEELKQDTKIEPSIILPEIIETPVAEPEKPFSYFADIKTEPIVVKEPHAYTETIKSSEEEVLTLNESLQKNTENNESSLSEFHQNRKIETIKGNISLNQKFLFINNLFGGNHDGFEAAIDELEICNNFNDAKDQMLKKYMPQYKWNLQSPEAEEFFDLLKRRFN